jgi:hypothetical protein
LLDPVVTQAKIWGFICQCQESKYWQILPRQTTERSERPRRFTAGLPLTSWKLQQIEDRWILIVGDVPQIRLHSKEAITLRVAFGSLF